MDISEIRQKRLEYFNGKSIAKSFHSSDEDLDMKKVEIHSNNIDHNNNNNNNYSAYMNYNFLPHDNKNETFAATVAQDVNRRPYSSDYVDADAARLEYTKKINEYKQIIEETYLNHVVNKQHQEIEPSSLTKNNLDHFLNSTSYKNSNVNYERKLSLDTLILTNRSSLSSSLSINNDHDTMKQPPQLQKQNSGGAQLGLVDTATNNFLVKPCTIQYMSAYNIYDPSIDANALHPLLQEQEKYNTEQQKQLKLQMYDSESSSLSSPVQQMNQQTVTKTTPDVNSKNVKRQSPRARLRLYQNNEDLNRIVTKYNGYSSSTSRSSSSPNSVKPPSSPMQPQPPPPNISSGRTSKLRTNSSPMIHEVRPPSAQKVNEAPNYRKKLIKKTTKTPTTGTLIRPPPVVANADLLNTRINSHRPSDTDSARTNLENESSNNSTAKENFVYDNWYKPQEDDSKPKHNGHNSTIPDLIQNCIEDNKINDFFDKFDKNKKPAKPQSTSDDDNVSDSEDTLNMSSRESLNNFDHDHKVELKPRAFNLAINLDELSGDDDEKPKHEKQEIGNHHDDDEDEDQMLQNIEQFKQTKPSYIPNLMLDIGGDDDKSISVAASLVKPIDYKKEMEKLQQNFTDNVKVVNNSSSPHLLVKQHQIPADDNGDQAFYLHSKPPPQKVPIPKPQQQKPYVYNSSIKPSETKTSTPHSKVNGTVPELFNSESFIKNVEKFKNNLPKNKLNELKNSAVFSKKEAKKNVLWESSDTNSKNNVKLNLFAANRHSKANVPLRSKSALQASVKELRLDGVEPAETNKKSTVLKESKMFDYKKLNEIELNINSEPQKAPTRPKSAFEPRQLFDDSIESNIQVPLIEPVVLNAPIENDPPQPVEAEWQNLPQEIWLNILQYLKHKDLIQFGRASKLFHQMYSDKLLWRSIKLKNRHDVKDEWLNWIADRQPNELSIVQSSGNVSLYTISEMFKTIGDSLNTLNLSSCFTGTLSGDNVVLQASIRCRNIRNLDLSWTLLSNESLKLVVDSFKTLESISLSGCSMIKEDGINTLLMKHGHSLKALELAGCFHLSPNCILNIGVYCRNLQKLNISNCHRVMNQTIMEACPSWTQLRFLDLRGIKNIKNNCISQLVRKCTMLDSLALANCIHLTDTTVLEIATYKPNFKYIDLKGCKKVTDSAMESISNLFSELEFLDLSATSITDNGLKLLCSSKCTKTLDDINLSFLPISEPALTRLIKASINLRKLHLYGCYNLKKISDIKAFALNENRKRLAILC